MASKATASAVLSSNIRLEHLGNPGQVHVRLCGVAIDGMLQTFGERPAGTLVALYGSTGNLIVSVVNGSAAEALQSKVGDRVEVIVDGQTPQDSNL